MVRVLGLLIGLALLLPGIVWGIKLAWIDHPEATRRLLWVQHWDQMLAIAILTLLGYALCYASVKNHQA